MGACSWATYDLGYVSAIKREMRERNNGSLILRDRIASSVVNSGFKYTWKCMERLFVPGVFNDLKWGSRRSMQLPCKQFSHGNCYYSASKFVLYGNECCGVHTTSTHVVDSEVFDFVLFSSQITVPSENTLG